MLPLLAPVLLQLSVSAAPSEVKELLRATVRVEVVDKRFLSIRIDTLPSEARAAALVNRRSRLFAYLVEHQLPARRLFDGTLTSSETPQVAVLRNLGGDTAAVRRIGDYLALATSSPEALPRVTGQRPLAEADLLQITARFFHPVVQPDRRIGFYRCAGINGIEGLGMRRDPAVEAFAFWGLAPIVFDADSSGADALGIAADFQRAKDAFRKAVKLSDAAAPAVDSARDALYAQMATSAALRRVMRHAYERARLQLPFRVREWERPAR